MRFLVFLLTVVPLFSPVIGLSESCTTRYTTKSTKVTRYTQRIEEVTTVKGPTDTVNYGPVTTTEYPSTKYVTSTYTQTTTFFITKASTTITVPTPSGFVPIVSARTKTALSAEKEKSRRRQQLRPRRAYSRNGVLPAKAYRAAAAATTKYPYEVDCIVYYTVTDTSTDFIYESSPTIIKTIKTPLTTTITAFTVSPTTTTVHTSLQTVYAACQPDNVIDTFDGVLINGWGAESFKQSLFCSGAPSCEDVRAAGQAPEACCNAIWARSYSGFVFSGTVGVDASCTGFSMQHDGREIWYFTTGTGPDAGRYYVGNGPRAKGYFGGNYNS